MSVVLDIVYLVLLAFCAPWIAWRSWRTGRYREGWLQKLLGRAPRRVGRRPCLWLHAVSVGEVLVLRPIVAEIQRRRPGWDVVISTTTQTGLAVARHTFPELVTFYAPLDLSFAVRCALRRVRPTVLATIELEVWPNWVRAAAAAGVKVAILNGRISESSSQGYGRIAYLIRSTFRRLDLVAAQTTEYAARFRTLGVGPDRVVVTGSVKYDGLVADRSNPRTLNLRKELGLQASDVVFVAGSTMEGEEVAAWRAYEAARAGHRQLRLVIVPRHVERSDRIEQSLREAGATVVRRSAGVVESCSRSAVILVDSTGELGSVWGLADVAFVGGSLYPGRNGQNMMEPAAYGGDVLFGPYTANFKEAVEGLLACGGARRVVDAMELRRALAESLDDPESAETRGVAAQRHVLAQQGATARTLGAIDRLMESPGPGAPTSPRRLSAQIRGGTSQVARP